MNQQNNGMPAGVKEQQVKALTQLLEDRRGCKNIDEMTPEQREQFYTQQTEFIANNHGFCEMLYAFSREGEQGKVALRHILDEMLERDKHATIGTEYDVSYGQDFLNKGKEDKEV